MLLRQGRIEDTGSARSLSTPMFDIYWRGLAYQSGFAAGQASVREFATKAQTSLAPAAAQLRGVFFMAVRNRKSGECHAFVDNSGLFHAFRAPGFAGTSFLQLAKLEGLGPADLDPEAVAEFVHFGTIGFGRTFFPQIRKIEADEIVVIKAGGEAGSIPKPICDIAVAPEQSLEEFLEDFAVSVRGVTLSLDLTGGIDSRLLAVALSYYGLPFELSASGIAGNQDLRIAEEVAKMLGRSFIATYHEPRSRNWERVFEICDGLFDPGKADRPLQLQEERKRRGVELAVSGAGGELFKDFWWLQDFPLYHKKRSSPAKLYAMRISPSEPRHAYLAGDYGIASRTHRSRTLAHLSRYTAAINTQTYDRVYYFYKMREFAGRFLTNSSHFLEVYAPYLERDAVRVGYQLPRGQRFFNRYHRNLITRLHPAAASIPTTEGGMTASSRPGELSGDFAKYVIDRGKRLARKTCQKILGRSYFQESADHPDTSACLREMARVRKSVKRLQEHGILDRSVETETLPNNYIGTMVMLDWVCERLEQRGVHSKDYEMTA